jgi:hypothetical protein
MLRADEDALVCDLAEEYRILDYRSLPAKLLRTLAAGLKDESRSKMILREEKATRTDILLASIVDGINRITWLLSSVCPHEGEPPKSVLNSMIGEAEEENAGMTTEEYEKEWARITGVSHGGR